MGELKMTPKRCKEPVAHLRGRLPIRILLLLLLSATANVVRAQCVDLGGRCANPPALGCSFPTPLTLSIQHAGRSVGVGCSGVIVMLGGCLTPPSPIPFPCDSACALGVSPVWTAFSSGIFSPCCLLISYPPSLVGASFCVQAASVCVVVPALTTCIGLSDAYQVTLQ